jgi:hypothetical protein
MCHIPMHACNVKRNGHIKIRENDEVTWIHSRVDGHVNEFQTGGSSSACILLPRLATTLPSGTAVHHSLLIGVLFICFNVDHRLLWAELTEESVNDGFQFYTTFYSAPPAIKVSYT